MPPLTMQGEGLTKGTSCPFHRHSSSAPSADPAGDSVCSVAATQSRCPAWEGVPTCVLG